MIAHLRGKLLAKHPNQVIVETGGVGYDVTISVPTFSDLPAVGSEVEKLITVSGIGPKLAITILSGMQADEMVAAIRGNDVGRLTRIPGIGRKTAERIVLELHDKLPPPGPTAPTAPALNAVEEDVLSALANLGYQRAAAEKALAAIARDGNAQSFDRMFRSVLSQLSK